MEQTLLLGGDALNVLNLLLEVEDVLVEADGDLYGHLIGGVL